jgi:hypothetical protein
MDQWLASTERLGARFDDRDTAVAVMHELRQRFGLGIEDIEVQALGSTHYEEPSTATLLAGRFPPTVADDAITIIRAAGGELVERRLEPDPVIALPTSIGAPASADDVGVAANPRHRPARRGRRWERAPSRPTRASRHASGARTGTRAGTPSAAPDPRDRLADPR